MVGNFRIDFNQLAEMSRDCHRQYRPRYRMGPYSETDTTYSLPGTVQTPSIRLFSRNSNS
jgi:hypothetical protein